MAIPSFKVAGEKVRPERVKPVAAHHSPTTSRSRNSSVDSSTSFTSAVEAQSGNHEVVKFSAEEEEQMVKASNTLKTAANNQFAVKDFSSAISTYDKALAELPIYLDYELAVLQSNIAACHLQLKEWKNAIESAQRGLDNLEKELPMSNPNDAKQEDKAAVAQDEIVELPDDQDEEEVAAALRKLDLSDQRKRDIGRIRTKLLLRRARARVMSCESPPVPKPGVSLNEDLDQKTSQPAKKSTFSDLGSQWGNLSGALSDYQILSQPEYFRILPSADQKTVLEMLRTLPAKVDEAKQKEVGEMMGKLKDLGNGILKPFGLSTDMFKMVQDPNTGGYSINFDQKAGTS